MNQNITDMDAPTLIILLIIGLAALALAKILQDLLKFLFVVLIAVFAIWVVFITLKNTYSSEPPAVELPSVKKDLEQPEGDSLQKDTFFRMVRNTPVPEQSYTNEPGISSEMKKTPSFTIDKSELSRELPLRPVKPDTRYNFAERTSIVTDFKTPSYVLAGAYAKNLSQAKRMAKYLNSLGFDHLFIIYLPDYDVDDAEGWPYAITITGAYGKLENLGKETNYFYHLTQVSNQVSPALDVLHLKSSTR